jgi:hypothetical protein
MMRQTMNRTLTENIDRGRAAIDLARQRGLDTTKWETTLVDLERQELLAWASELAEKDLILTAAIRFEEEPLRPVAITEVSKFAVSNLKFIAKAALEQRQGGWHIWTSDWWSEREHAALGSLAALRAVFETCSTGEPHCFDDQ